MPKYKQLESYYMNRLSGLKIQPFSFTIKSVKISKESITARIPKGNVDEKLIEKELRGSLENCLEQVHSQPSSYVASPPSPKDYSVVYDSTEGTASMSSDKGEEARLFLRAFARIVLDSQSHDIIN